MAAQQSGPNAPMVVERFVKQLNITFKAVKLYPLSSSIPRENGRIAVQALHQMFQLYPEAVLEVGKDGLFYEGLPIYPGHPAFIAFAREFYNRGLAEVRFHSGTAIEELLRFLSILDVPPADIASSGGFESRLWEHGVSNIAVKEVSTRIVEVDEAPDDGDEWPPVPALIDEILVDALGRRPRAQRLLTRLVADGPALRAYLTSPSDDGSGPLAIARRLASLSRSVRGEEPAARDTAYAALARSLEGLEPEVVREVLMKLLTESRHDDNVAAIVRSMPLETICAGLFATASFETAMREELARTVRNLVSLGLAPRDRTMGVVAEALEAAGMPADVRDAFLEDASPSHLRVRERRLPEERPVDIVLRMLDVAADNVASSDREAVGVEDLAEEAGRGITDGDVFGALVTMITLDSEPEAFASMMSMMENNLGLLLERRDFDVAADAAEALVQAEQKPGLSDSQRQRIHRAVAQLADPGQMRIITSAMRMHRAGSAEYEACRRLLGILGENTMSALLEVLADEKDMASRKALVDMISAMADRFIPELGERVTDGRWYFVRNVVSILGATHSSRVLPYLERTLRHSDARVRRETVRAISGIKDALADEMLIAALRDDDGGIVQLAARYLGSMKLRGAVPALQEVARGVGHGNRDIDGRIEAIGALGRIASPDAAPVLEALARQRIPLRASRARELKAAAEGALAAIKAAGGGKR